MTKSLQREIAGHAGESNRLLAGLPDKEQRRLLSLATHIELEAAAVLYEPGERIRAVHFPTGGAVSLVKTADGQEQLQVGLVGDEGMVGTAVVLGMTNAPSLARVQDAGTAWRIESAPFRSELERSTALRAHMQRYLYVVMCQAAQTIACTRFHLVDARLARWLLMTRDRAHSDHFHATHEALASSLGVRRAGITHAAGALQLQKLIHYSRGDITVLDYRGLEAAACTCYLIDRNTYAKVMN